MSAKTSIFLRDDETVTVSLMELTNANCVGLSIEVKSGYRVLSDVTIISDSPEQELLLRMLAEAYEKSKNCIPLELV
jgi:hypothetical protein